MTIPIILSTLHDKCEILPPVYYAINAMPKTLVNLKQPKYLKKNAIKDRTEQFVS